LLLAILVGGPTSGLVPIGRGACARADELTVDLDQVSSAHYLDRWMYPFNMVPGTRIQAPLFGATGTAAFDERDGQYLLAIDSAGLGITPGLERAAYQLTSDRLVITEAVVGYAWDPTYDSFRTHLDPSAALFQADSDAGRPIELFGAGLRNGYSEFGWPDGATNTAAPVFSSGTPLGPSGRGTRSVFAADARGNDVSNHVDTIGQGAMGVEAGFFAIGQAVRNGSLLEPGGLVEAGDQIVFDVDLTAEGVHDYFSQQLAGGQLGVVVSSLHAAAQSGGPPIPNMATANHFAWPAPVLTLSYELVEVLMAGDLDGDRDVDSADLLSFLGNWTGSEYSGPLLQLTDGEMDGDGDIDTADLLGFLAAWTGADGASQFSPSVTEASHPGARPRVIPEPAVSPWAFVLACIWGWPALRRRLLTDRSEHDNEQDGRPS
jgi:hypothetical protein